MTPPVARRVWTREGLVALSASGRLGVMGATRQERTEAFIDRYAQTQPAELRDATHAAYIRAYRRAGLLPGDPDAIDTQFPARSHAEEPIE